jgi:hypothetical protein
VIILERVFDTDDDVIRLELREPEADQGSFRCGYRLSGAADREAEGWGVDPVQALLLALERAHLDLLTWRRDTGRPVTFMKSRDLALPLMSNVTPADFDTPMD